MVEPLLHFRDVGSTIERVGRSGSVCHVRTAGYPELFRVATHDSVNAVGGKRPFEGAGSVVADRPEEGAILVMRVLGGFKIIQQQFMATRM